MDSVVYLALFAVLLATANAVLKKRLSDGLVHVGIPSGAPRLSKPPEPEEFEAQYPEIDRVRCIGCHNCIDSCPEKSVLQMVEGRSMVVNPSACLGHQECADACCVQAIWIRPPSKSALSQLPYLTEELETNVPNLFVAGELGGYALIASAVNEGRDVADTIAKRLEERGRWSTDRSIVDVCIVGAGPAGVSASLRAIENGLTYVTIERDRFGGSVAKYPRRRVVTTRPVDFPIHGKFRKYELSRERLLAFWEQVAATANFRVQENERVVSIKKDADRLGVFTIETHRGNETHRYRARHVVLAIGRRGTPKKLGIPGEELGKVMHSLPKVDRFSKGNVLIVGGGDGAVEAAVKMAKRPGVNVTLSYRGSTLKRGNELARRRMMHELDVLAANGRVKVIYDSAPVLIEEESVTLGVRGAAHRIKNDFVWIFAGGQSPAAFLRRVGVELFADVTVEEPAESPADEKKSAEYQLTWWAPKPEDLPNYGGLSFTYELARPLTRMEMVVLVSLFAIFVAFLFAVM